MTEGKTSPEMAEFREQAAARVAYHAALARASEGLEGARETLVQDWGVERGDPAVDSLMETMARLLEIEVRACAATGAWLVAAAAELGEERFARVAGAAGAAFPWEFSMTRALMALARDEELQALLGGQRPWWRDASEDLQDRCVAAAVDVAADVIYAPGTPGGEPTQ